MSGTPRYPAGKRPRFSDLAAVYFDAGLPGMEVNIAEALNEGMSPVLGKRKNADAGGGPFGQFVRRNDYFGIPRSLAYLDSKLKREQYHYTYLRWSRLSKYTAEQGTSSVIPKGPTDLRALSAKNCGADADATDFYQSVYAWDLTCRNSSGVGTPHPMCKRLIKYKSNPPLYTYSWDPVETFTNTGISYSVSPNGLKTSLADFQYMSKCGKSVLKDVSIKMLLQGKRTAKTTYYGYLMQFLDPELHPHTVSNSDEHTAFWAKFQRQNDTNPLTHQPRDFSDDGRVKVLKRWTWKILPDSTTNSDTSAPILYETLKLNFNRICNWDWSDIVTNPTAVEGDNLNGTDNPNSWQVVINPAANHQQNYLRDERARIYFVLKCYDGCEYADDALTETTGEPPNTVTTPLDVPMFDIRIDMHHINQPISYQY